MSCMARAGKIGQRTGERDMAEGSASVTTLKSLLEAFNAHDLDRIMSFFAED
jgi:ketosteroid isomerase-like protein